MKFNELVDLCIECINGYRPDLEGPDYLADRVMKKVRK